VHVIVICVQTKTTIAVYTDTTSRLSNYR